MKGRRGSALARSRRAEEERKVQFQIAQGERRIEHARARLQQQFDAVLPEVQLLLEKHLRGFWITGETLITLQADQARRQTR